MAAGEDQPKTIVGDFGGVVVRLLNGLARHDLAQLRGGVNLFVEPRPAPDKVDGFVPCRLDDPGTRKFRDSSGPPLVHAGRKGFLRRLFGHVKVTHEANQGRNDPAPVGAIKSLDSLIGFPVHALMVNNSLVGCRFGQIHDAGLP